MPFVCIVSLFALQTRLYAALVLGEFTNAYLFSGNIPSGSNAVVELISQELGFSNMITRASRCYPFYTLSYEVKQS